MIVCIMLACNGNDTQTDESDYDSSAFHIAILPVEECHAFMYADSCGLYDSLGVRVKLHLYESEMDADTAFTKGWSQMEIVDSVRMAFLLSECDSDSIISVLDDKMVLSLVMSRKARVRNINSLSEKIVALTRNSSLDDFADKITEKAHLRHDELNRPQINNIRMRAGMLIQGQYDGAILPEPWATMCVDSGANRVTTTDLICPQMFHAIVNDSINKVRKDDITKIVQAYNIAKLRIGNRTRQQ